MKHFVSWNVNGIRAIQKKEFASNVASFNPDVLCLQETKASKEETLATLASMNGYHLYANSSKARKGYSGTAILSKEKPIHVAEDMGLEEFDQEGRVLVAEFLSYYVVTVYTPNSGAELARLDFRKKWDVAFRDYMDWLNRKKPVIACGDFNVAHQAIDLARPKENYNKSAGYMQEEIDGFTHLLKGKFIDSFRHFYPEKIQYSYWNTIFNGREKNIGWRIDHFLVNERLKEKMKDATIYDQILGSDHSPVSLTIDL